MLSPFRFLGRRLAHFLSKPRAGYAQLPTSAPSMVLATLRRGDVLLVEGHTRFSTAIKYLTQSTWSHAALYIGDHLGPVAEGEEPKRFCDVDINDGVRVVGMSEFSDLHMRICRPVGLDDNEINTLIEFMVSRVGNSYDLKNILDLARYLIRTPVPTSMKRKFIALGSGEPTKAICSSLLAQAFESIQYPILPSIESIDSRMPGAEEACEEILHIRHHSLYMPRDFDVSPFFQVVKPRLESGFDFRNLVWSKSTPAAETELMPTAPPACPEPMHSLTAKKTGQVATSASSSPSHVSNTRH